MYLYYQVYFLLTGIGTGILMLFGYCLMSTFTQILIIECGIITNASSYENLASKSIGIPGEILLAFFMTISLLTGNCGHIQNSLDNYYMILLNGFIQVYKYINFLIFFYVYLFINFYR